MIWLGTGYRIAGFLAASTLWKSASLHKAYDATQFLRFFCPRNRHFDSWKNGLENVGNIPHYRTRFGTFIKRTAMLKQSLYTVSVNYLYHYAKNSSHLVAFLRWNELPLESAVHIDNAQLTCLLGYSVVFFLSEIYSRWLILRFNILRLWGRGHPLQ